MSADPPPLKGKPAVPNLNSKNWNSWLPSLLNRNKYFGYTFYTVGAIVLLILMLKAVPTIIQQRQEGQARLQEVQASELAKRGYDSAERDK